MIGSESGTVAMPQGPIPVLHSTNVGGVTDRSASDNDEQSCSV